MSRATLIPSGPGRVGQLHYGTLRGAGSTMPHGIWWQGTAPLWRQRSFFVYVPVGYVANRRTPVPLVVVSHGAGGDGVAMQSLCNLNPVADANTFIVVYLTADNPVALESWGPWNWQEAPAWPDDAGYAGAVVAAVQNEFPIDPGAIYAVGISNGSAQTNALAETYPTLWAAIGIISAGGFTYGLEPVGAPLLPVFSTHGTGDATISYGGSQVALTGGMGAINAWCTHNGCSIAPGARNADAGGFMASGSPLLGSTGMALGGFVVGDRGANITVLGAGNAGTPLTTTISSVTDATHVILAANAGTAVNNATLYWGTSGMVPSALVAGTTHVYQETFGTPGTNRGDIALYSIAGGTHTWPGPNTMKSGVLVNSGPDAEWDVNPSLWAFLSTHRKP